MTAGRPENSPSPREKIISSANFGMLAGFWVELPLLCSFFLKSNLGKKSPIDWQKMNEWSMKLVLPATLVGVAYGWNQPNREEAKLREKIERIEHRLVNSENGANVSQKSWVMTEQNRSTNPELDRRGHAK